MDHTKATEVHAAERYLLGELPAEQAEDFERHYFECAECAEAVEAGGEFIANARAVMSAGERDSIRGRASMGRQKRLWPSKQSWWIWPRWIPVTAAAALAVVVVYQGAVVIPGMRQALDGAQALPAFQLSGLSRGAESEISVPAGNRWISLAADIPPDARFLQYEAMVTSGSRTVLRVAVPAPAAGQPITVLVPSRNLSPGDYEFTVFGMNADGQQRDKVTTSRFKFQFH